MTGESPVVDVQTARQQMVIDGDIVRALRRREATATTSRPFRRFKPRASGAARRPSTTSSRRAAVGVPEGLIQLDGMNVGAPGNGGGVSGYLYDMSNSSEVQVAISGGLGEADRGGPAFNIIPKTGGNTFSGTGFTSYAGGWGQSSNIDDHLRSLGFGEQPALIKSYDANIAVGGPILRDRVWFYGNSRAIGTYQEQQNLYDNLNAGNPNAWTWARSDALSVRNSTSKTLNAVRLTWQATQKNKFGFYIDYTKNCSGGAYKEGGDQCRAPGDGWVASGPGVTPGTATVSPESGTHLGRAREDHAGVVDVTALESDALRERLFGVLYRQRRSSTLRRADGFHSGDGAVHRCRSALREFHLSRLQSGAVEQPEARHLESCDVVHHGQLTT